MVFFVIGQAYSLNDKGIGFFIEIRIGGIMMDKQRILIVEDEEDMVQLLTLRLESAGYQVTRALDGNDGLAEAKKYQTGYDHIGSDASGHGGI